MNFIKTLNELLTKSLCILFFSFVCQLSYGQTSSRQLQSPSIDVTIGDVEYVGINGQNIEYNATLDFTIDFGTIPLGNITEYGFDLRLSGFDEWTLPFGVFSFCNGGLNYEVTQSDGDGNLFHIRTYFPNGVTEENICENMALASTGLILELPDLIEEAYSADCWDETNMIDAVVEVTNAELIVLNTLILPLNDVYYEESIQLPGCIQSGMDNGEFDVNIAVGAYKDEHVFVDVYFRYTKEQIIDYVNRGVINIGHNREHFEDPTWSSSPLTTAEVATFFGVLTKIAFDDEKIVENTENGVLKQIYVGRLIYKRTGYVNYITSEFKVNSAQFWNQDNESLSSNVTSGQFFDTETVGPFAPDDPPVDSKTALNNGKDLKIYPVPAKDKMFIEIAEILNTQNKLELHSIDGKLVETRPVDFKHTKFVELDVSHLNKGIYMLNLSNAQHNYQTKVLID